MASQAGWVRVAAALAAPVMSVALAVPAMAQAAAAARDASAEAFVQTKVQHVMGVLNDRKLGQDARRAAFQPLIAELVDWPRLTRFVLAKYARTATPDQMARFTVAYRNYEEGVFQRRINDYRGQTAKVTGSVTRGRGDVIVVSRLSGGHDSAPTDLAWRVLGGGNSWKVVDVQVEGVWMAITQQQDFVSTIDNHGGKIDVLIAQLQADPHKAR
jgi:phospholipid transport system substrate-binding protein